MPRTQYGERNIDKFGRTQNTPTQRSAAAKFARKKLVIVLIFLCLPITNNTKAFPKREAKITKSSILVRLKMFYLLFNLDLFVSVLSHYNLSRNYRCMNTPTQATASGCPQQAIAIPLFFHTKKGGLPCQFIRNKKVLLRERRRHNTRHVAKKNPVLARGVPHPVLAGGWYPRVPPIQTWNGVPHLLVSWMGYPPPGPGMGYRPVQIWYGVPLPHLDLDWGTPHPDQGPGIGYRPQPELDGIPPGQD